jgi:aspartyl-tRNA(Asn)/glutamyl-tRNA(Gln) amidotransferase subunit A
MTDTELKQLTLAQAALLIRRKKISPVELTEAVLDRIDRINDRMRAFITVTGDLAMKSARTAERQLKNARNLGPLHGVPISLKDLYDTKGIRTTAGSKVFADRIPTQDATVVKKLRNAGAVLVGKTNLHEFAFGVTTANPHYGVARNPFDPDRISGGSSGGSASAVALSLGFGSLGSDTGGSIRIPASMCGIAGLKPTYGLASLHGVIPLSWSLDHAGPMAQTVEDVALLLGVIAGYDRQDPRSRRSNLRNCARALTGKIKRIRVGVPRSYFFDRVAPEVESAVRSGLKILEKLGARLVEVDLPSAPTQGEIFRNVVSAEACAYHEEYLRTRGDQYGADVRERLEFGRHVLFVDYARAQRARNLIKSECAAIFDVADVMITPTVPIAATPIGETTAQWGEETEALGSTLTRFTRPFNLAGLPAMSIPCGFTAGGLPIGMQIAGRAFDELTVLRVAHAYERATHWSRRRPEM